MRSAVGVEPSTNGETGGGSTPADRRDVDGGGAFGDGSWAAFGDGSWDELSSERRGELADRIDGIDADVVAAGGGSRSQQIADSDAETRHPRERLTEVMT